MESLTCNYSHFKGCICFWKIGNFSLCESNKPFELKSHVFTIEMLKSKFYFKCKKRKNYLDAYIFKDEASEDCTLKFEISIITSIGCFPIENTFEETFKSDGFGYGNDILEWDFMFQFKELYLPNESLTLFFHIWNDVTENKLVQYFLPSSMVNNYDIQHSRIQKQINVQTSETKKLKEESTQTDTSFYDNTLNEKSALLHLFKEKGFRFVTLRTASKDFIVHEAIICARSPVFQAMFDLNMKENERRLVDIDDIDTETLTLLLRFLHLEPLGDMQWEIAAKLYYAADKYQIQELKEECASNLKHKISNHNVCEMFVLSDLHQDKELKQCAQEYFCKHMKEVLLLKEWNDLLLNKTELAAEILRGLAVTV